MGDPDEDLDGRGDAEPRRPRIVTSLQRALPGDLLPLTASGEIMSRVGYRARTALGWTWFALTVVMIGGFWGGVLGSVTFGVIAGGGAASLLLARWWRTRRGLLRATAELAAGRPVEARAALRTSASRKSDSPSAFARDYLDFRIDWALGEHEAALHKAAALARRSPRNSRVAAEHAWLLAVAGQAEAAVAALAAAPEATGAFLSLIHAGAELRIAFLVGELPAGFDFDRLHALAREVLQTSLFGGLCVLLAWAFDQRGDEDMARHMLDEAPARLHSADLATFDPPLHAWFQPRMQSPPSQRAPGAHER